MQSYTPHRHKLTSTTIKMYRYTFLLFLALQVVNADIYQTRRLFQTPYPPVLLIPGLGGSILNANNITDSSGTYYNNTRIWVTWGHSAEWAKILTTFDHDVYADQTNYGLYGISYLDPDLVYPLVYKTVYYGYLIESLQTIGYVPGVNLFGYPYDWRKNLSDLASDPLLDSLITTLNPVVVAHSYGGLVLQEYIRNKGEDHIRKVVYIGTPFKGVGGNLLRGFYAGYDIGNRFIVDPQTLVEIARNSYSTYELLPSLSPPPLYVSNNFPPQSVQQFISNLPGTHIDRYKYQEPVSLTNTKVVYIYNSAVQTPYNYNYQSNSFASYVSGDGTVPIGSSNYTALTIHKKLIDVNDSNIDHTGLITNNKVVSGWLLEEIGAACNYEGKYVKLGIASVIEVKYKDNHKIVVLVNDEVITSGYVLSTTCTSITYNGVEYSRIIGSQCANGTVFVNRIEMNYWIYSSCVYGYIRNHKYKMCNDNEIYDSYKDLCYKSNAPIAVQQPPQAERRLVDYYPIIIISVASSFVFIACIIVFAVYKYRQWRHIRIFHRFTENVDYHSESQCGSDYD